MIHQSLYHHRWMVTVILCIGVLTHASAQTFTERVQKKVEGKGTVTIHQSEDIDQLVNDPNATGTQQPPKGNDEKKPTGTSKGNETGKNTSTTEPTATAPTETVPTETPVKATQKVMGYRVQAFAGGNSRKDRQMAEQTRNNIKAQFPNVSVYVHFYSPRWICRVGNFRTYEEAHQMMVSLQKLGYKQASIVKGKITVAY